MSSVPYSLAAGHQIRYTKCITVRSFMSKKAWMIFVAVVVVILGGLIYLSNKNKVSIDTSKITTTEIQPASAQSGMIADHVFGPTNSKVTLIEYGDYQCPGCGAAYPNIKQLTEKYQGQLTFVFRNFPLSTIHPNARAAAAVAEAAGLQGKFWEMHNALYENQNSWNTLSVDQRGGYFDSLASQLGLNQSKFTTDLSSSAVNQKIGFDQALGGKDKVQGTPTFYLNGKAVNQYVKDGKIVSADTQGANPIWGDAAALDTLLLQPALKEAGISLPAAQQ